MIDRKDMTLEQQIEADEAARNERRILEAECARITQHKRIKDAIDALMDELNHYDDGTHAVQTGILDALTCTHRTLQQQFVGTILQVLLQYGALDAGIHEDGRNQAARALCQWLKTALDKAHSDGEYPDALPFI